MVPADRGRRGTASPKRYRVPSSVWRVTRPKMLKEEVPCKVKELLESQQLNGVPVLLSTTSDLSLAGDARYRKRFEHEAKTISRLQHPHVCTLFDVGSDPAASFFLVMEHLEGETLEDRLRRGRLAMPEALGVGREIAEAMEAAHRHGLVHRDLKPGNVMLTEHGAKVLDFGLAQGFERAFAGREGDTRSPTMTEPATEEERARSTNSLPEMPSAAMAWSISITSWLAPPWRGPQSALMPAETAANRFTCEEPTSRTVLVEQFCSWSACRISSMSIALATTGSTSYRPHGVANIM